MRVRVHLRVRVCVFVNDTKLKQETYLRAFCDGEPPVMAKKDFVREDTYEKL